MFSLVYNCHNNKEYYEVSTAKRLIKIYILFRFTGAIRHTKILDSSELSLRNIY